MPRLNGQKIRELRKNLGWSQGELARKAGVALRTILSAEKGLRLQGLNVSFIAEALGVRVEELWLPDLKVYIGDLPTPLGRFFGREQELKELDAAWEADACRVVTLVGGWGTGKSALISEWLKSMQRDDYRGAVWVVGWSFRGQGSTDHWGCDNFFHHALTCFGDPNPDVGREDEKALRLRARIGHHRTLLILDGLEPLQSRPTEWEEGGQITDEDEAMRRLIRHLASQLNGLCLITSRFPVLDLSDFTAGGRAGSVWDIRLPPLDLLPATKLLQSRNLHGPEEQFNYAVQAYHGNPLSLTVLAGVLLRRYGGDIARWREIDPSSKRIDRSLSSLECLLTGEEKAVMRLTGLFDGPAEAEAIQALRAGTPIPALTDVLKRLDDSGWAAVLWNLRDLQLLAEANNERPLDLACHPAVRAYFAKRLEGDQPEAWRDGHLRLYGHFKKKENLNEVNPRAIDNLYLAIHHGCRAGHHADVFDELVWEEMCAGFAFRRLNGHGAGARDEMVLRYFIRDPFSAEPQCDIEGMAGERRARLYLWASTVLHVLGRVRAAVKLTEHAQQLFGEVKHRLGCWFSSGYLSWFLAASGNLDRALKLSESCVQGVNRELRDEPFRALWEQIALCLSACLVSHTGDFRKALKLFEQAMAEKRDIARQEFDGLLDLFRFNYACLLLQLKHYQDAEREAQELVVKGQVNPILGFLGYQALGRMELAKGSQQPGGNLVNTSLRRAKEYLDQGKDYLNLGPAHDLIINNALFMARFNRLDRNLEDADHYLKQAEDAVGDFALLNIDCLLERAWLCLAQGDKAEARENSNAVRKDVDGHGYHCIDGELKDLEKKLQ